jgi:ATP-binding cassette subfamily B protein
VGGIIMTLRMDAQLALILLAMLPIIATVVFFVTKTSMPLYTKQQTVLDRAVGTVQENITGIRVIKALSKTEHEKQRFHTVNSEYTIIDQKAGDITAITNPSTSLALNIGLTLVVLIGAFRVDSGAMKPGVILAFLTYFNMILQSIMGINRMFIMISKASASANRIDAVLQTEEDLQPISGLEEKPELPFIHFSHVNFRYQGADADGDFNGMDQEQVLNDISFSINRGESLGIIGPTGCGKTTIINLLMRFYDPEQGEIYIDGRDVRSYDKKTLHEKFGVAFQNDMVFNDTLENNIDFGRNLHLRFSAEKSQVEYMLFTFIKVLHRLIQCN